MDREPSTDARGRRRRRGRGLMTTEQAGATRHRDRQPAVPRRQAADHTPGQTTTCRGCSRPRQRRSRAVFICSMARQGLSNASSVPRSPRCRSLQIQHLSAGVAIGSASRACRPARCRLPTGLACRRPGLRCPTRLRYASLVVPFGIVDVEHMVAVRGARQIASPDSVGFGRVPCVEQSVFNPARPLPGGAHSSFRPQACVRGAVQQRAERPPAAAGADSRCVPRRC